MTGVQTCALPIFDFARAEVFALSEQRSLKCYLANRPKMAPEVGFEPTTNRLTADRSTTELRWIALGDAEHTLASPFVQGKRRFGTKEKLLAQHSFKKLVAGAGFEPATFRL